MMTEKGDLRQLLELKAGHFVTLCLCLGMWLRRSGFILNTMLGIWSQKRGRSICAGPALGVMRGAVHHAGTAWLMISAGKRWPA
jgi:hypothetical protein